MIAVFCRYREDFESLNLTPKGVFIHVRNSDDIRGRKFSGIIRMYDCYSGGIELHRAYECLQTRQPELFK